MEALTIEHLSFAYPKSRAPALQDLCFSIPAGSFTVLCGPSGSGKSTLLRLLSPAVAPWGARQGQVFCFGKPLAGYSQRELCETVGFVFQNPDSQLVTDKVWHELAFGLESLGLPTEAIRARVAETASFFGLQEIFEQPVAQLSGGQKQLVNLAAALVLRPRILLLDEPTAQLDPLAAEGFLAALARVNRELGVTVLLSEHRLETAMPYARQLLALQDGRLLACGEPGRTALQLSRLAPRVFLSMPSPLRIFAAVAAEGQTPIS